MRKNCKIIKKDCVLWMKKQKAKSIDLVITSPPYNLNIKYANYEDQIQMSEYLTSHGHENEISNII